MNRQTATVMRGLAWAVAIPAVLALTGCGKDDIESLSNGSTPGFTITVDQSKSTGSPTYSWTGGNVDGLFVLIAGTTTPVWDVLSTVPGSDSLPSPYTHGDPAPPNTGLNAYTTSVGGTPTNPLTTGTYTVTVQRASGASASATFAVP